MRPAFLTPARANWRVFALLDLTRLPEYRHEPPTSQRGHSAAAFSDRAPGWRLVGAVRGHGDWHRVGTRGAVAAPVARAWTLSVLVVQDAPAARLKGREAGFLSTA
jgi:hypothetical protein